MQGHSFSNSTKDDVNISSEESITNIPWHSKTTVGTTVNPKLDKILMDSIFNSSNIDELLGDRGMNIIMHFYIMFMCKLTLCFQLRPYSTFFFACCANAFNQSQF